MNRFGIGFIAFAAIFICALYLFFAADTPQKKKMDPADEEAVVAHGHGGHHGHHGHHHHHHGHHHHGHHHHHHHRHWGHNGYWNGGGDWGANPGYYNDPNYYYNANTAPSVEYEAPNVEYVPSAPSQTILVPGPGAAKPPAPGSVNINVQPSRR